MTTALVLSGGGMFGAWQAGAWSRLASTFQPDLIVGASVGSLNGYAIASGWTPEELCAWWLRPEVAGFKRLPKTICALMTARPLQHEYAVVLVDLFQMKPKTFRGSEVTPIHLLASCAVPGAILPQRLGSRWYLDGGLLNPLPVWAAVEMGATRIVALNALPTIPSALLAPFVKGFRGVFGHHPPVPSGVHVTTIVPGRTLGSMRDALVWNQENIVRWIEQGAEDVSQMKP